MNFYDYDFDFHKRDVGPRNERITIDEALVLCRNGRRFLGVPGAYCRVYPNGKGHYVRETQGRWKAGRRYSWFRNEDDALAAGIKWVRRKEREWAREEA